VPTYQYKCKQCDHRFEVFQRITEDALTECPECHGLIQRVLFPAGVVFKGSGWYVTDYRNGSEKAKYEADSKGEAAPSGSSTEKKADAKPSETSTESKAESKTETKTEAKTETPAKAA
jgi:putative FmdB family regulatory protein